jgi:hypothetical protein
MGRHMSVSTATCYGMEGVGFVLRWGSRFYAAVQHNPGALRLLYNGYRCPFLWVKRPERGVDHPFHLAPTGIQSPDRPLRSQSLYLLSYRGPQNSMLKADKKKRIKKHLLQKRTLECFHTFEQTEYSLEQWIIFTNNIDPSILETETTGCITNWR